MSSSSQPRMTDVQLQRRLQDNGVHPSIALDQPVLFKEVPPPKGTNLNGGFFTMEGRFHKWAPRGPSGNVRSTDWHATCLDISTTKVKKHCESCFQWRSKIFNIDKRCWWCHYQNDEGFRQTFCQCNFCVGRAISEGNQQIEDLEAGCLPDNDPRFVILTGRRADELAAMRVEASVRASSQAPPTAWSTRGMGANRALPQLALPQQQVAGGVRAGSVPPLRPARNDCFNQTHAMAQGVAQNLNAVSSGSSGPGPVSSGSSGSGWDLSTPQDSLLPPAPLPPSADPPPPVAQGVADVSDGVVASGVDANAVTPGLVHQQVRTLEKSANRRAALQEGVRGRLRVSAASPKRSGKWIRARDQSPAAPNSFAPVEVAAQNMSQAASSSGAAAASSSGAAAAASPDLSAQMGALGAQVKEFHGVLGEVWSQQHDAQLELALAFANYQSNIMSMLTSLTSHVRNMEDEVKTVSTAVIDLQSKVESMEYLMTSYFREEDKGEETEGEESEEDNDLQTEESLEHEDSGEHEDDQVQAGERQQEEQVEQPQQPFEVEHEWVVPSQAD